MQSLISFLFPTFLIRILHNSFSSSMSLQWASNKFKKINWKFLFGKSSFINCPYFVNAIFKVIKEISRNIKEYPEFSLIKTTFCAFFIYHQYKITSFTKSLTIIIHNSWLLPFNIYIKQKYVYKGNKCFIVNKCRVRWMKPLIKRWSIWIENSYR